MNNRQNGRRRGRGGQQARNGQPGVPDRGNRLDNRARGNAAQLLEKYKTLARDAQMQGDRVNTEYYLQFADHYFRVLSESRSRFEEQQQQRRGRDDFREEFGNESDDGDDGDGQGQGQASQRGYAPQGDDGWDDGDEQPRAEARPQPAPRPQRDPQPRREPRAPYQPEAAEPRANADSRGNMAAASQRAPLEPRDEAEPRRESRRGRRPATAAPNGNGHATPELALDALPARIQIDLPPKLTAEPEGDTGEAAPKPRRGRKPKATIDAGSAEA